MSDEKNSKPLDKKKVDGELVEPGKAALGFKKVSFTKEKQRERAEKLEALSRTRTIKKTVERLDIVSNALFILSFVLIIFILLRYLFYVCYGLNQCESVNWFWVVGLLAIVVVFLIIARVEKTRVKKAILKLKRGRLKTDVSKQTVVYSTAKLQSFVTKVENLRNQVMEKKIELSDANHDLYLIFKSFISEYLRIPKALSTTALIEKIRVTETMKPELREYSAKLLEELFDNNYEETEDEKEVILFTEATRRAMLHLLSYK